MFGKRTVKLLLVACVLAGGVTVAILFFRKDGEGPSDAVAEAEAGSAAGDVALPDADPAPATGADNSTPDEGPPPVTPPPADAFGSSGGGASGIGSTGSSRRPQWSDAAAALPPASDSPDVPGVDRQFTPHVSPLSEEPDTITGGTTSGGSSLGSAPLGDVTPGKVAPAPAAPAPIDNDLATGAERPGVRSAEVSAAPASERVLMDVAPRRSHKIVDGDTLASLARRYLGDAGQASAIYEANRHVLPSPDLLPIGAELTIPPPADQPPPAARRVIDDGADMVPVPPR